MKSTILFSLYILIGGTVFGTNIVPFSINQTPEQTKRESVQQTTEYQAFVRQQLNGSSANIGDGSDLDKAVKILFVAAKLKPECEESSDPAHVLGVSLFEELQEQAIAVIRKYLGRENDNSN